MGYGRGFAAILAMTLAIPGGASALPFGISDADIAAGHPGATKGGAVSFASASRSGPGPDGKSFVELRGVRIEGSQMRLVADRLQLRDDGQVVFGAQLEAYAAGKGRITFSEIRLDGEDTLERILFAGICEPSAAPAPAGNAVNGSLSGLRFVAPDNAMGTGGASEGVTATHGRMAFLIPGGADCVIPTELRLENLTVSAADGSTATIGQLGTSLRLQPRGDEGAGGQLQVSNVRILSPEGSDLGQVHRIGLEISASQAAYALALNAGNDAEEGVASPSPLPDQLLMADLHFAMTILGADLPAQNMLGRDYADALGFAPDERITLDLSQRIAGRAGSWQLAYALDAPGLARSGLDLNLIAGPDDGAGRALAMIGEFPGTELIGRMSIVDASFSFEDLGGKAKFEAATGRPVTDLAERMIGKLARLPAAAREPVAEWLRDLAREGKGSFVADPLEPVGLMQAGMGIMMNPQGLGTMLGISTR